MLASSYRFDLGDVAPGETREGSFMLSNPTPDVVRVHFAPEGAGSYVSLPAYVDIAPGASFEQRYRYTVPANAPPGHHGESVRLLAAPAIAPEGVGSMDAATAMVFTSRTRAVGVTAIEGPTLVVPGEPVQGRVIVVNLANVSARVGVKLAWLDGNGANVTTLDLPTQLIPSSGTSAFPYQLPDVTATAGVQTLRAVATLSPNASARATTQALDYTFLMGIRSASAKVMKITDLRDGNATITGEIVNTGTVPITFRPRVTLHGEAGAFSVVLDPMTLQPGERREISAILALPPGRFSVAILDDDEEAIELASLAADGEDSFVMTPAKRIIDWDRILSVAGLALVIIALVAAIVWLVRSYWPDIVGALARARTRAPPPSPDAAANVAPTGASRASRAGDDLDALFSRLEMEEALPPVRVPILDRKAPVALLVDFASIGAFIEREAIVRAVSAGRDVAVAHAYATATSEEEASQTFYELQTERFVPHVRVRADMRVDITIDAMHEARLGRVVVLITHDPAFSILAKRLRAEGSRVELAGVGWRIPVGLREDVDAVHDLGALRARPAPATERTLGDRTLRL